MKYSILPILLFFIFLQIANSQIWEEVSTPFDYERVNGLTSMNNEVFVSKYDWNDSTIYNFQYNKNEWVRAEDDTIYEEFKTLKLIDQYSNRVLISCLNGLYLSEDSARNWSKLEGPNFSGDCDISPNGIFAIKNSFENHLFKYDEVKKEWKQIPENKYDTLDYFFVKQIESNNSHLFALQQKVANPFKYKDTVSGGLFVSTDKGESWEKTLIDSTLLSVFVFNENVLVSTKDGRLWKSINNGKTWTENNIGTTITNFTFDDERIIGNSYPKGIVESRDNGKTWYVLNELIITSQIFKKEKKYFFLYNDLVYESDSSFTEVKPTNLIRYDSRINNIYYYNDTLLSVGNFGRGVQYSTDTAKSWHTYYPILEENRVYLTNIYYNKNQIYLLNQGFYDTKIYTSNDFGDSFNNVNLFLRINDFTVLENKILIASRFGIKVSENYGETFNQSDTNTVKNNFNISKIAQTDSNELLAFSIFNGVFKSSDEANTWELLVDSLPTDTTFASIEKFYEFGGSYYIVNSSPLRILKSNDNGISWSKLEIDLFENIDAHYLEMIDENNILLSSYGNGIEGLRITNDQGKTWRRIDDNLPLQSEINENIKYIYSILGRAGNNIFIGSMTESYLHGNLFVSSLEKLGVKTSVETQRNYLYTLPPYPLPSQNEVKVQFYWDINLPMTVDDITVYDITGRKLITKDKIRLEKQADHYGNLIWDCSNVEPGIYLINIKHGTEERSVKVVVE